MILYTIQYKFIVIHVLYFCVLEVHKSQNVKIMELKFFFSLILKFWRNTYTKFTKHLCSAEHRLKTIVLVHHSIHILYPIPSNKL
jgi:hypothetical protein